MLEEGDDEDAVFIICMSLRPGFCWSIMIVVSNPPKPAIKGPTMLLYILVNTTQVLRVGSAIIQLKTKTFTNTCVILASHEIGC